MRRALSGLVLAFFLIDPAGALATGDDSSCPSLLGRIFSGFSSGARTVASPFTWALGGFPVHQGHHEFPHGVRVWEEVRFFGLWRKIFVQDAQGNVESFWRTSRGLGHIQDRRFYPEDRLDPANLRGQRVLDVGTGSGAFVHDLRSHGIDAHGVDIYLSPRQRQNPNLTMADAQQMPFANQSFDVIYCNFTQLSYVDFNALRPGQRETTIAILRELHRCFGQAA